jgi:predicted DNA-binding protein
MISAPDDRNVSIKMNDEFINRLDDIAHLVKCSRNQMIRNILVVGVEELQRFKSVGIIQLSIMIRDIHESIIGKSNLKLSDPVAGDKPIPIKLDGELITRLDDLAKQGGLTRHQLVKNLLRVGVEEAETMAKFGILQLSVLFHDLGESFRKFFKQGEEAYKVAEKMK